MIKKIVYFFLILLLIIQCPGIALQEVQKTQIETINKALDTIIVDHHGSFYIKVKKDGKTYLIPCKTSERVEFEKDRIFFVTTWLSIMVVAYFTLGYIFLAPRR